VDDDAHAPSLSARMRLLERLVRGQAAQLEAYRQQQEADRQRIAELARVRAQEIVWDAAAPSRPQPPVPPPRNGRHKRDRTVTYLRVVRVATILALGVLVVAGAVIPASSIVASPARATQMPRVLCDPPGFAPPSQDAAWRLVMTRHPERVPCIGFP
jgi:hypothetical protein